VHCIVTAGAELRTQAIEMLVTAGGSKGATKKNMVSWDNIADGSNAGSRNNIVNGSDAGTSTSVKCQQKQFNR
jgi:hypothetical protein